MAAKRKAASPSKAGTLGETASKSHAYNNTDNERHQDSPSGCNSTASQRTRILYHLRTKGSLTTNQARHYLDVMHPGMRVCELRKAGHPIITVWVEDITPEGNLHRVGKYILAKKQQLSLLDYDPPQKHVKEV